MALATPEFEAAGHQDPGQMATVYGFGDIGPDERNQLKDLHKVNLPIVSNDEANTADSYAGEVDETMLAAGYADGGKDSCQGDSGGPLVIFVNNHRPIQIGVVSWGDECASPKKYGIYSRVSKGYEWIMKTTGIQQ